jgi:Ca2+:H+ antiporter
VARKILWASLALAPVTVVADFLLHFGDVSLFVLASVALIPLAWLIGEATDHAAHHTGPGIGGFLNATFGNAPELIIALFAIHDRLPEVVRGSLTGSVVGNLLLVLGFSLLFGRGNQTVDRKSSFMWLGLILVATLAFLIPAIPGWHGNHERHSLAVLSLPVAVVLLVLYVGATWWQLRRFRRRHESPESSEGVWSLPRSVCVLAVATALTAVTAEILVGSIENFADKAHLSDFFVAAVIVAIVGNAAEHGGAVLVAYRGKIELAAEIALSSSAQVAVFLIPAVALLSWTMHPLALSFRQVELGAVGFSALVVGVLFWDRRSSNWHGAALIGIYGCVAAAFFFAGDRG